MENLLLRLMCKNEIKKCNLIVEMFDDLEYIKQIEKDVIIKIQEYNKWKDKINYYFITDKPENIGEGQSNFRFSIVGNNFLYNFPDKKYSLVRVDINDGFRIYIIHYYHAGIYYVLLVSTYNNIVNKIKIDSNKSIEENLKLEFVLPIGTELPYDYLHEDTNKRYIDNIWEYYQKRANELFRKPE